MRKILIGMVLLVGCRPALSGDAVDACQAHPERQECAALNDTIARDAEQRRALGEGLKAFGASMQRAGDRHKQTEERGERVCDTWNRCYFLTGETCGGRLGCISGVCLVNVYNKFDGVCAKPE